MQNINIKKLTQVVSLYFSLSISLLLISVLLKAQKITVYNMANTPAFTTDIFRTVGVGKGGYVYAGTLRQGLYKFDGKTWQKMSLLSNNSINDIQHDDFGGIWIGQSGYNSGGNQAITGGIDYFPDSTLTGYTQYGTANGIVTNNCRGILVDKINYYFNNRHHIWGAHIPDVIGGVTKTGGVGQGLNVAAPFFTRRPGTDSTNKLGSVQSIGGNETEVWGFANANYGKNQLLRYNSITGAFLGVYDETNVPQLFTGFYARSILFDTDKRQWVGLSSGGIIVKNGTTWTVVNMPTIFPTGTIVNNNSIFEDAGGKVYVGTNNGLAIYSGGQIDNAASWKLLTTTDGLPHNNVFDICENESTGAIVIGTTGGIAFMVENVKAKLVWDYSFSQLGYPEKPKGVAADGVSRLYIKITGGEGTPTLQKAEISIIDNQGKPVNIKGKLKRSEGNHFSYNEEASTGGSNMAVDTAYPGTAAFWFWYISPEDYCNGNTPDALEPERKETVKIVITFSNGSKDSTELDIKIVRPPLVMVHGLASGPSAWNGFHYTESTFINSGLFKHKNALRMSGRGSFKYNASYLLDDGNLNSLQYNINTLREMGYASNQVDYVCHSMGGLMLRSAIQFLNDKYLKGTAYYKSYGKGYVHKMITINTPHNSSPIADLITEYVPQLDGLPKQILEGIYKLAPDAQKPFDFIEPSVGGNLGVEVFPFIATPAVQNLQVRSQKGGINLGSTIVKNHMIASNVNWPSLDETKYIIGFDNLMDLIDDLIDVIRDLELSTAQKIYINSLYGLSKIARSWAFIERYSTSLGYPSFLANSDLVVPLSSQIAKQDPNSTFISTFSNSSGYLSPSSYYDANHVDILDRVEIGNKVLLLLNAPINSNLFADIIPANLDVEPPVANKPTGARTIQQKIAAPTNTLAINTQYGTTKLEIITPITGGQLLADSTVQVNIKLKDTVGLAYIKVYFQNADTATNSRQANQTFSFTINPSFPGEQNISAIAVYDKPGGVEHHIDTLIKFVTNNAITDSFRLKTNSTEIIAGETLYPSLEIHYSGKWVSIPYLSEQVTAQVQHDTILNYKTNKSIIGLKQGISQVYFSYLSFKDTLRLSVNPALYENTVNRTLASGNVRNPTVWSKGRLPHDTDSIVVMAGHIITIDTLIKVRAIKVEPGGKIQVADTLEIGEKSTGKIIHGIHSIYDPMVSQKKKEWVNCKAPFAFSFKQNTSNFTNQGKTKSLLTTQLERNSKWDKNIFDMPDECLLIA